VTLVELVIAIVVISICTTGVLHVMNYTTLHSADAMVQSQAVSIAESYLEEILSRPYRDPDEGTICAGTSDPRALFDDVCDYQGLFDSGARDRTGAAIAGLSQYDVLVNIDTSATLGALSGSSQVLRVDVTVKHGSLGDFVLSGYRTDYGP